jgi:hypothetical protein
MFRNYLKYKTNDLMNTCDVSLQIIFSFDDGATDVAGQQVFLCLVTPPLVVPEMDLVSAKAKAKTVQAISNDQIIDAHHLFNVIKLNQICWSQVNLL